MTAYVLPAVFAIVAWWFATGAILWVGGRQTGTRKIGMMVATGMALCAFGVLIITRQSNDIAAVYGAFSAAIIIWGWHELSFLYGFITGPRKTPCPSQVTGISRFFLAVQTVIFHELAILLAGIAIAMICLSAENTTGLTTYLILWVMRISAKLNLFFGALYLADAMMPGHLSYLKSYFKKDRISLFFPLSVTLATIVFTLLVLQANQAETLSSAVQLTLLASLLGLAIVEHWFFVIPLNESRMWSTFMQDKTTTVEPESKVKKPPSPIAPKVA